VKFCANLWDRKPNGDGCAGLIKDEKLKKIISQNNFPSHIASSLIHGFSNNVLNKTCTADNNTKDKEVSSAIILAFCPIHWRQNLTTLMFLQQFPSLARPYGVACYQLSTPFTSSNNYGENCSLKVSWKRYQHLGSK